ncbi:MAG: 50S ribosomal protein L16 [Candidatus Andersenbacteria bacterium RIFCSPHIGHO2_02_FULL_45_11]|uniref:Large ribosomal subunit protein uL16 n=1 Tax=Candidatus Andersenbacteria bacterium RIFCSPHIGHO2_12_FULL_45_11 TaxID=1797281 RepID=A0A1G1X2Z1_9BACT|nr:MAG: 50S ribosomal protein L16 [Candidatus Andersenbacteria bacterium RIFCSPHIGHO2_01_FULL_46_36]OGY34382.1 MAG: 50S ribosomal protein L16 [Candidatus Andersenbacteria bacterium RIFCSPHIGHO2_12_FULL_45_11]OGY34960.1 MAG: 50S ribosomal protein L16 [Candidatus Andersenbacteria bacterium RIFCSPHIGHO2_02_FULL_45_11]
MSFIPRKVKHRKHQKGSVRGAAKGSLTIDFGQYGLKAMESRWVSARQLEAARRAVTRYAKRSGKVWIRIFPDKPVTAKGQELPMGKGKGSVDHFVAVVHRGRIVFEVDGMDEVTAREGLRLAAHKLPLKTKFIAKVG